MENLLAQHLFEDQVIEFDLSNPYVMVNATEMASVYGKKTNDFLRTEAAIAFLSECCKEENFYQLIGLEDPISDDSESGISRFQNGENTIEEREKYFVNVVKGGKNSGTWMHRVLALKFAAWLSPKFELWVYCIIEKIIFGPYKEIDKSVKRSSEIKKRLAELAAKIEGSADYIEKTTLENEERREASKRAKSINSKIKGQMEMFA